MSNGHIINTNIIAGYTVNKQFGSLLYVVGSIFIAMLPVTAISCSSSIDQSTQYIKYQIPQAPSLHETSVRYIVEELSTIETEAGLALVTSFCELPRTQRKKLKEAFINEHLVIFNRLLNNNLTTYSMPTYSDEQQSLRAYAGAPVLDGTGFIIVGSEALANGSESGTFLHLWIYEDFFHPEISNRQPRSCKTIRFIDTSSHAPHAGKSAYYPCTRVVPSRNSSRFLLYVPHEIQVWSVDDSYALVYETTLQNSPGEPIAAAIHTLSLSPDGSYLALSQNSPSSKELILALTDPTTSRPGCSPIPCARKGIAAWSSCGAYLVSISLEENTQQIIVWTRNDGTMVPTRSYHYPCPQTARPLSLCVSSRARFLIVRSGQPSPTHIPEIYKLVELSQPQDSLEPLPHIPFHSSKSSINSVYDLLELSHDERYCLISPSHKGCTLVDLQKQMSLLIPAKGGSPGFINNGHLSKGNHFILNITMCIPELISLGEPFCHLSCTELFLLYRISRELEKRKDEDANLGEILKKLEQGSVVLDEILKLLELEKVFKELRGSLISKPVATVLLSQLQISLKAALQNEQES